MASQDDLGMLWYGVPGMSFNPTDPSDVMLNSGATAPLLSDQPRHLAPSTNTQQEQTVSYDSSYTAPAQMLYDPATGDYINHSDYIYDPYEGYEEESSCSSAVVSQPVSGVGSDVSQDSCSPHPKTKKPKVHQNPALKLQTPIAYKKDTDLNAIPIMKEGMAVCEKCGAIGVKHAFYGRYRKYCSLSCARPPSNQLTNNKQSCIINDKFSECSTEQSFEVIERDDDGLSENQETVQENDYLEHTESSSSNVLCSSSDSQLTFNTSCVDDAFNWDSSYLDEPSFRAAPVPMSECWEQMSVGMKVEVSCQEEAAADDAYWVATLVSVSGYKAKLRFEGFVDDSSKDFWVNLCTEAVHPVGWCATQGKPLIPPKSIQNKYSDWKEFLMRRLTGARTLPTNFLSRVAESQKSRFRPGLNLEVVDKNRIAQMRVATVTEVKGRRLHLKYHGAAQHDDGFWCHEDSPVIHPVGWSLEVGHEIVASQSYHQKCIRGVYEDGDAGSHLFVESDYFPIANDTKPFIEGMKLEAVDPLNLSTICVASILKVLDKNYLMIRIDSYKEDTTCSDWFCYHSTSPYIFPAGFCEQNGISLTPPKGHVGPFSWNNYIKKTGAVIATHDLFPMRYPVHDFKEGMCLESVDLMDPRLICVARVRDIKGPLLRIHFDGWESEFDQWVDCESPDICPIGWCEMSEYKLEGPRVIATIKRKPRGKLTRKTNYQGRKVRLSRGGVMSSRSLIPPLLPSYPNGREHAPVKSHFTARRGKSRGRMQTGFSQNINDGIYSDLSEFDNDLEQPSFYRGSGKKMLLTPNNVVSSASQCSVENTIVNGSLSNSSHPESGDDAFDENSSGVASLAGSEMSHDAWEIDDSQESEHLQQQLNEATACASSYINNCADNMQTPVSKPMGMVFPSVSLSNSECEVTSSSRQPWLHFDDSQAVTSQASPASAEEASSGSLPPAHNVFVPRLSDGPVKDSSKVQPKVWLPDDVSHFLKINECGQYCENFIAKHINGERLLSLTQKEVMELTGMKVGPSLKILDLIHQLLAIVNPAQARYQATLMKRSIFGKS